MTVPNASNKSGPYVLDGVATVFARTFLIVDANHLAIIRTENGVKTEITTGFIIDGVGNFTGNVTISPALTGGTVTLVRRVPNSQETDYSNQAKVAPAQVENDFDLVVMQIQDLAGQIEGIDADALILAATAAADSAVSAEASAATVAGDVDQIIAYIGAQLQTVNTFTSIPQFETYDATFSYWLLNSVVQAGGVDFQKRSVSNGDVVANAWVALGYADKLLDGYLPKASGVVKHHHIANMPAFTLLANDLAVSAAPFPVTYEKVLSTMGVHSYGDTQSGGISAPLSSTVPNAPNGLRCGRGTSSAGETTVTFSNEFAPCIPNVMISPRIVGSGAASLFAMLTEEPTVTGFKFIIRNAEGTAVAAPYHFIAMGQDD